MLVQPNLLVYGTAGLAVVHAQAHGSVTTFGFGQISASASDTGTGLVYGIGVESMWTERMSVRLEYLGFSELGDFGIVRAGLNFKLGP